MAEATAKTVKISQVHLECPICCCRFSDPKILDCLHSFCLNCLDELVRGHRPQKNKITCPICRRVTVVPDGEVAGLSNCFFLSSLVDEVNKQEQTVGLGNTSVSTPCEECDEGLEAVSRCLDCDANICKKCKEAHERMKSTKTHCIIGTKLTKAEVSTADLRKTAPQCAKHTNHELCFYCYTCEVLVCAKCAALDHRTAEHQYSEVADAMRSFRQNVDEVLRQFEKSRERFSVVDKSIEHARNRLTIMADRACRDVSAKEEEEIAKIRNKARLLRAKVTQIREDRDKKFQEAIDSNRDKMNQAERIVATVNDLMQQADDFELLDLKPKVMHNLSFQEALHFEQVDHGLSFIGVKTHDIVDDSDLGEIFHKEKWQLKKEFGTKGSGDGEFSFGRGVACFSHGDIAVADTRKHQIMVFDSNGCYKTTIDEREEENKVGALRGVAVTSDDLLLVTYKRNVKIFDSNLQFIRKFKLSDQDGTEGPSESFITGIAVDKSKRVAVADNGRKAIALHSWDGSLISTVPSGSIDYPFALSTKERLIFTNCKEKQLVCTDLTGKDVFRVGLPIGGGTVRPAGVCCDAAGDIYVSVYTGEGGKCEVHHFDPEGVHIERVAADGLYYSYGMTFTPSGDLLVVNMYSVMIFERT